MPIKTSFQTEDYLRSAALPQHGKTYTVIPHGDIIDQTRAELTLAGFEIERELYKTTTNCDVAQGIYHLKHGDDQDMGLMFAWSNSYNKTMRFKCAIGARVFICTNGMVSGDLSSYQRRHSGPTALQEAVASIKAQMLTAKQHFSTLIKDKEMLKTIVLSKKEQSSIIGQLYADQEILTVSQMAVVKREMDKPSFNYNADPNSAWSLYNHITLSLKDSHPMTFLSDHEDVHKFFVDEFGQLVSNSVIAPEPDAPLEKEEVLEEVLSTSEASYFSGYDGVLFM